MDLLRKIVPEHILKQGEHTDPEVSVEIAWPLAIADEVLEIIHQAGLAILGGDIYTRSIKDFKPTYDHWAIDIEEGEKWTNYTLRSYLVAQDYLSSNWLKKDSWFVLVVTEKPDAEQLAKSYVR